MLLILKLKLASSLHSLAHEKKKKTQLAWTFPNVINAFISISKAH